MTKPTKDRLVGLATERVWTEAEIRAVGLPLMPEASGVLIAQ